VFDLFHIGHLRYLQYARQQGTHLTAAVSTNKINLATKDKCPAIDEAQRLEIVAAVRYVDAARLQPCTTDNTEAAADWIAQWGIHHVVVGGEWEGSPRWNRLSTALAERNITVSFAPKTHGISSTSIIARIQSAIAERSASGSEPTAGATFKP
jgi:cytidyltransferase-like protein